MMSNPMPSFPTQAPTASSSDLPTAAIVCIAVGGYVVIVVIILVIRQCCLARGMCGQWTPCGKEDEPHCCECCISLSESCDCCKSPSISSCLDSICPNRKNMTCVDIILCQCCGVTGGGQMCNCGNCNCNCVCEPDCGHLNCCCFQVEMSTTPQPTPRTPQSTLRTPQSTLEIQTPRSARSTAQQQRHVHLQTQVNRPASNIPRTGANPLRQMPRIPKLSVS